jgi:hypothetical protein
MTDRTLRDGEAAMRDEIKRIRDAAGGSIEAYLTLVSLDQVLLTTPSGIYEETVRAYGYDPRDRP